MGRTRFLIFYIATGAAAAAAQTFASLASGQGLLTPMIGASGAISGVMGAYMVLYPRNKVYLLTFGFFPLPVSAWVVLAIWFLMQLGNSVAVGSAGSGVAYAAHIGGFLMGWLWACVYKAREKKRRIRSGHQNGVSWRVVD